MCIVVVQVFLLAYHFLLFVNKCYYRIAGFFHGWKFSLFNFSWVDILAFGATLHRICIVEEILVELILAL